MGKKRHTNAVTLGVPLARMGGFDVSDTSDLESVAISSVTGGDLDTEIDDDSSDIPQISCLPELLENIQDKKISIRVKAMDNIIMLLSKQYLPEILQGNISTMVEVIEKNLKRTLDEALRMCTLAALISLQLGVEIEEQICAISSVMRAICIDPGANEVLRAACAQSLGLCTFLSLDQFYARHESLQALKNLWLGFKPSSTDSTSLFTSALYSWVLLLKKFTPAIIMASMDLQPKLCTFLESSTVECRISTGEVLAILFEIAVQNVDEGFQFKNQKELEIILADLVADSAKFRAKRDKKLQRMTFRQINDAIFGDGGPLNLEVRFNRREKLTLERCHQKLLYEQLCQLLRGDLNRHLTNNEFLRELFGLGPVLDPSISDDPQKQKAQKTEAMSQYSEQSKSRNIQRTKHRAHKHGHRHVDYED